MYSRLASWEITDHPFPSQPTCRTRGWPPLLITSSLDRIERALLTTVSQRCMFAAFATGVFLLKEV